MAAFEYLKQYVTFQSVDEMDAEVEKHIQTHYYNLTASERAIVFKLASHALEYPGVCHLKASTIADGLEISVKTVQRAIKKLTDLQIIKKQATKKMNGIKGANIYIFLKHNVPSEMSERVNSETTCESKKEVEHSENQPLQSFNLLKQAHKNNKYIESVEEQPVSEESKEQKIKQYGNKYQQALFDFIHMMPFSESILNAAYEISLAISMETKEDFILAKDTIKKVAMDMLSHLRISSTVRGVVATAYNNAKKRRDSGLNIIRYNWLLNKKKDEESIYNPPPVDIAHYDWLTK